ncbi:hypothetical protein BC826DRAFT_997790 [Russula brevipes]|nr:hypothetical protein BC826DRAFT_997790 [Russula brevipes]
MESNMQPDPLLRSYDDVTVLLLETLHDPFFARELEQRRFSKTQEGEWITRIAEDVRKNERAIAVAERWFAAISLSDKREFCNFVLPPTDEAFRLFVQFFWLIKTNDRAKANQLLADVRRKWGLEPRLQPATVNNFLESGDSAASYWTRYPRGLTSGFKRKAAKSQKTLKAVGRKRSTKRPSSSRITKRPVTAQPSFKRKNRLDAKDRLAPKRKKTNFAASVDGYVIVNTDVAGPEGIASLSQGVLRRSKRKLGHDGTRSSGSREIKLKLRPEGDKRPRKTRGSQRASKTTIEHSSGPDGPELLRRSVLIQNGREHAAGNVSIVTLPGKTRGNKQAPSDLIGAGMNGPLPNVFGTASATSLFPETQPFVVASDSAAGASLASEPGMLSCSIPESTTQSPRTCSVDVNGRASKRSSVTTTTKKKKFARNRQPSALNALSSCMADRSQTPVNTAGREAGAGDEDDSYDCTLSGYPGISSIALEKEQRVAMSPKPPLPITPPIWAQSRQEVCESLDSFRSYQGGVYHSNDIVKGYLLGAHSSSRDLFHHGGKLIISHGGGKAEALHSKNHRIEIQGPGDQSEDDRSVRALLNNYRSGRPLVVLADDNYALFPYDLTANGYTYVVLGLYWIAHAWAELQRVDENHTVVRYKFAFQWCEGQGDPWWSLVTEEAKNPSATTLILQDDGHPASLPQITKHFCPRCRSSSPIVYQDAPMCLQPGCAVFFRESHATADSSRARTLSYSTELLRLRPANHQPVSADSLFPPSTSDDDTTSRPFAKGMHCKDCGRLSTRFKWEHYECCHCHRIYEAPSFLFSHKDFWLQEQTFKYHQYRVAEDSGIVANGLEFRTRGHGSALPYVQTFELPQNRGRVHLIPGHPSINFEANALFRDYQRQAARGEIQFRRWPLRAHKCRGQLLSNYFSQNTGAPYQYIGGAERTTPLEDGATAVLGALALIKDRIATALGTDIPFNEVLSAAYMEKQKMAFHSDSERGLGPVVASLSLGSAAEMHFRLHSKYTTTEGHRKVAMSLVLRHGDVLVMEGAGVQEYYEHAVVPKNFRIVATARFISSENYT